MAIPSSAYIRVAPLAELQRKGVMVVRGADRPIAVFWHQDRVAAVDNRCPHLGFPLHRGSVQDGILTCHWHHARFDLCSGCTFDLWADDTPKFDVEVRDGIVHVADRPRQSSWREQFFRRLHDGLEQNVGLIQFKCLIGLLKAGTDTKEIVREIARFGVERRDDWASGLTILAALANIVPQLAEETAYFALTHGSRRVADDCEGQAPRRTLQPLETRELSLETLQRWLHYWTMVRHRDGAERTVLTAVRIGAAPADLAGLVAAAATDRFYADTGHLLDFCNKAFELLDLIGWEQAAAVMPSLMERLVRARGGEEMDAWRHPIDLVPALRQAADDIPAVLRAGENRCWDDGKTLCEVLLADDPLLTIAALRDALAAGARPVQVTRALAYAAAVRIARFGTANEFGDWITALHTFTYCNALHQLMKRCPSAALIRGVFHGAISIYLDRFLNVPPAQLPAEGKSLDKGPSDPAALCSRLLGFLDQRHKVDEAAQIVARYVRMGHSIGPIFETLARAVVREDADFHTFQILEAGIQQYREWPGQPEGETILLAMTRFIAAHSPTQREHLQTAEIALRLHRGESIYQENGDSHVSET
jgi:nitrite reductase/ring-hydroxylating ferredoxin subunit